MEKTILLTGGAGFIGSNLVRYILKNYPEFTIINVDKLTYAGSLNNLIDVMENKRHIFKNLDICDNSGIEKLFDAFKPDYIINLAAESHVDRSINCASLFSYTNVYGTSVLLENANRVWNKHYDGKVFLQVSTDEVYGSLESTSGQFKETNNLLPNSPYSSSKAGADLLLRSFYKTYELPGIITRCCNNYGPHQHSEKFIPTCIISALQNKHIPIYGSGKNHREWIYVEDHCKGIMAALLKGKAGEIYNLGSGFECSNIELAERILDILGKPHDLIRHVNDRPGHDFRYAIDCSKATHELGFNCLTDFNAALEKTVDWYVDWYK